MKETIGIIGITGDLGSQLAKTLAASGIPTIGCSLTLPDGPRVAEIIAQSDIIHVCAPLTTMHGVSIPDGKLVVLHDSVMSSSLQARTDHLQGNAAIVHMLMNSARSVVVAQESAQVDRITGHLQQLGYTTHHMSVVDHDQLMARSQAPLAVLCQVLLPFLFEQQDKGLLTPSGELLASTLHSRQLAWTDETIRSILSNPELKVLLHEITSVVNQAGDSAPDIVLVEKVHKKYSLGAAIQQLQRLKR